jgi:hypothetical protein
MRFEDFDIKIKEAAEKHHPAYDENAWHRMKKLLDQHLPQKEDNRRRAILILLLCLLIGGGTFIAINKPWQNNKLAANNSGDKQSTSTGSSQTTGNNNLGTGGNASVNENASTNGSTHSNNNAVTATPGIVQKENVADKPLLQSPNNNQERIASTKNTVAKTTKESSDKMLASRSNKNKDRNNKNNGGLVNKPTVNTKVENESPKNNDNIVPGNSAVTDRIGQNNQTIVEGNNNVNDHPLAADNKIPGTQATTDKKTELKNEEKKADQPLAKTSTRKKTNGVLAGFAIYISAGPDASKAGGSQTGKTSFVYGAGLSYTVSHFTLRAGVYKAEKIYKAGAKDYKLSYNPPPDISFEGVDANCKVIEIPVSLSYNFGATKRSNWFASAGLSSYLMKKENYNYWYKNNTTGYTYPYAYEVDNKNKHYFSVLDISAGYTRQLNNVISVSAEPYLKLPMKGVGEGKVNLNSAGLLLSVGIHPFNHKK